MFIVCGIDEFVRDGFDGVVAVADGFGAVVEGEPLVEGRVLSRLKGLTAAGNLARRNNARQVADQTSNIRMAFVLNLPDIDVRVVLSQLQQRRRTPVQSGSFSVTHTISKSQISKQPSLKTLMDKLELLES